MSDAHTKMTITSLLNKNTDGEIINIGSSKETVSLLKHAELTIDLRVKSEPMDLIVDPYFEMADRCKAREI